jgi:ATP-dependent metalloprotease
MEIHKATIIPRGQALGMVSQVPGDEPQITLKEMIARIDVACGGRVAEEIIYGKDGVTSGASSDIETMTRLARAMVARYGLSEAVGLMTIDEEDQNVSAKTRELVDQEVRRITAVI